MFPENGQGKFCVQCPVPFLHFCMTGVGKCTVNCALSGFAGNLGFLPVLNVVIYTHLCVTFNILHTLFMEAVTPAVFCIP